VLKEGEEESVVEPGKQPLIICLKHSDTHNDWTTAHSVKQPRGWSALSCTKCATL